MKNAMILLAFAGSLATGFAHAQTPAGNEVKRDQTAQNSGSNVGRTRDQVVQELIQAQKEGHLELLQRTVYRGGR